MIIQIIWDIDGTLLDTRSGVAAAVAYALEKYGLWRRTDLVERILHTPKITQAFIDIVGMSQAEAQDATDVFRRCYLEKYLYKATPYAGILELLNKFEKKGIKQSVATNKRQDCAEAICGHFGISKYCQPIVGSDRYNSFTKKELIEKCMSITMSRPTETVYIGDMEPDRIAAEELGIAFIGVNYGLGFQSVKGYANEPRDILTNLFQYN